MEKLLKIKIYRYVEGGKEVKSDCGDIKVSEPGYPCFQTELITILISPACEDGGANTGHLAPSLGLCTIHHVG